MHFIVIFLLNNVLFPVSYMGDQNRYLKTALELRESLSFFSLDNYLVQQGPSITYAALLFSLFPILFIDSVYSIAMINTTLYTLMFIFLYTKGYLNAYGAVFYFFFPSLMLYTGVALRDTWILFFMLFSIYFFINNRYMLSALVSIPLIFIKYQNFVIYLVAIGVYVILTSGRQTFLNILVKLSLMLGLFQILLVMIGVEYLDFYRFAFFIEDGGKIEEYVALTSMFDVLFSSTFGAFEFLLKPFLWQASGVLQLVQSLENIAIFYILYLLFKKQIIVKDKKVWFLLIYLFVAMSVYGLIVFNYGTSVRYRYTFVTIFILFSYYLLYIKQDNSKEKN